MQSIIPIYIINRSLPDNISETLSHIEEKHSDLESVNFQNAIVSENFDPKSFNDLLSLKAVQKFPDGKVIEMRGSKEIYKTLIHENRKSLLEFDAGFIGVTVPRGSNNESEISFDFFQTEDSLANHLGNLGAVKLGSERNGEGLLFQFSCTYLKMANKREAVNFLKNKTSVKYINQHVTVSNFFVIKADRIKVLLDGENYNCGKGKSLQRIFYLFKKFKRWMEILNSTFWMEFQVNNNFTFEYSEKNIITSDPRSKGVTRNFITKSFDFPFSYSTGKFFIPGLTNNSCCVVMINFMTDFDEDIKNFYGTINDFDINEDIPNSIDEEEKFDEEDLKLANRIKRKIEKAEEAERKKMDARVKTEEQRDGIVFKMRRKQTTVQHEWNSQAETKTRKTWMQQSEQEAVRELPSYNSHMAASAGVQIAIPKSKSLEIPKPKSQKNKNEQQQ